MLEEKFVLRNYAHIGDAVWEVFVREFVIEKTSNSKALHKMNNVLFLLNNNRMSDCVIL